MKSTLQQTPVAIIGMAGIFPQAKNLREYWENIINKVNCITDVPPSRWHIDDYYDPDPSTPDKTYCKRGGFIPDIDFNPMEFGLPPNILEVTDVSQLLSLIVAKQAMADAGYGTENPYRQKTGVILGVGGGQKLITPLASRLQYPVWKRVLKSSGISDEDSQKIIEKMKLAYIPWEENSFPGMLGNVIAGRIANRLDLGGINCVVDAACAGSLAALRMTLSELTEYRSDMMITGGVDTDNSIFMYMSFSKTPAFSKQQNMKPFDVDSDGMMIGEGIGMLVLKRLEDAKRDGDRIYAVIKGIGTSSDGKYKSIYAPRASGQSLALRRAYESAGFATSTVGMIEAHGTGTVAGDPTEFAALKATFSENNLKKQSIALGSVKSQIGHTKATAGAASLIKTALALHHKILPPTINITQPDPQLEIEQSPFYLNTETRPWLRAEGKVPRRAGVSAFGFGGTNYHVVLEEYQSKQTGAYRLHKISASILLFAQTPTQLLAQCENLRVRLQSDAGERHYAELIDSHQASKVPLASARLGFVAKSLGEACDLLQITIDLLKKQPTANSFEHPKGIHYRKRGFDTQRKVVALFAGQGSQYLEMGRQLALNFPPLRQAYAEMDTLLLKEGLPPISNIVFPCPVFDVAQKKAQVAALQQTENAQPAIGAFSIGLYKILQQAGFKPDFVAGHSFGELTALWAADVFSDEDYFFLAQARGQAMASPGDPNSDAGAMLAVTGDINDVQDIVEKFPNISVANWNSNIQVVLGGPTPDIETIQQVFEKQQFSTVLLPVSAAFHTPLVEHAHKPFAQALNTVTFNRPKIPVYSNITGTPYPDNPAEIRKMLASHMLKPVGFKRNIENLSAAGGYLFIEFGPRNILTALVSNLLEDKPHFAVALNASRKKDSDYQLRDAVIQLRVAGLPLHHLDPYSLKSPIFHSGELKGKRLTVRLNGANYVSDKTRAAFENTLQNGHQVSKAEALKGNISRDDGHHLSKAEALEGNISRDDGHQVNITNENQTMTQPVENRQRVLEQSQTPLNSLQEESGHIVHQQYLKNMGEYSQQFFQLMQQQYALLTSGNCTHAMLESFERSMTYFHEHQAQMQRVHEQYLKNQVEYSQTVLQLMPHSQLATGDATAQAPMPMLPKATAENAQVESALPGVSPVPTVKESAPPAVSPTPTVKESAPPAVSPTPPTTSIPVASNRATPVAEPEPVSVPVSVPEPVSSNDSSLLQDETTVVEETKSESVATPAIDLAPLTQSMLNIVSDKTGYPADMLEVEMDMEADLGIDSIKRVEILGAMQEQFPDLPPVNPEELAELRTLAEIVEYMGGAEKKKAPRLDDDEQPLVHNIQQHQVKLKPLPAPDCLDLSWASDHICLLTDDGTPTTIALAKGLTERGFLVVMLSFPDVAEERQALPTRVNRVVLTDLSEAHLKQQLAAIADNYGPIGAFIHLNPLSQDVKDNILGRESEKNLLKSVFVIAKHLKRSLNEAAHHGRSFFVTVTRLDGELGLGQHTVFQ
ncbi:MAG TPA: acyltransferase domain-containing protein, partial [Thioploca sp.]|nr:acyltransferase domain-containing protein [Thioploca sp.]